MIKFCPFFLILIFAFLACGIVHYSPAVTLLDSITLTSSDGSPVTLGYRELGQKEGAQSAERSHLSFRNENGRWFLSNIASGKKVDVRTDKHPTIFVKRFELRDGDRVRIGDAMLEFSDVAPNVLRIVEVGGNRVASWREWSLVSDAGRWDAGVAQKVRAWLRAKVRPWLPAMERAWLPAMVRAWLLAEEYLFSLGVRMDHDEPWAFSGLAAESVWVTLRDGRLYLAPGREHRVLHFKKGQPDPLAFQDVRFSLDGEFGKVTRIVVGRTYYDVDSNSTHVTLSPTQKIDVFHGGDIAIADSENVAYRYETKSWIGAGDDILSWIHQNIWRTLSYAFFVVIFYLAMFEWYARKRQTVPFFVYICLFFIFISLILGKAKYEIDISFLGICCAVMWTWATFSLLRCHKMNGSCALIWNGAIVLAGIGLVVMLQMFAGAANTRWIAYAWKQTYCLMLCGLAVGIAANVPHRVWGELLSFVGRGEGHGKVKAWLYGGLLLFLLLVAYFGKEQGFAGFQPSELMKLFLAVMAACNAVNVRAAMCSSLAFPMRGPWSRIGILADVVAVFVLMLFVTGFSLVAVRDVSPLVILGFLALFWIWTMAPDTSGGRKARGFALCFVPAVVGIGAWIYRQPEAWTWIHQFERFAAWSDPARYPHSGAQVVGAMRMAGMGGWFGAPDISWFGGNGIGNALPAVQDDFALSFLLFKFGGVAGMLLLAAQIAYFSLLMRTGRRLAGLAGDYSRRQGGMVWGYSIQGLAVIHGMQWIIAWGNALGLLPVMGQPMTWLSAGNSHLAAVGVSALLMALAGNWALESGGPEMEIASSYPSVA